MGIAKKRCVVCLGVVKVFGLFFGAIKYNVVNVYVLLAEGEGEEGPMEQMEQMIITNGFVDERGHYLVNGTSYEIYDPNTNTVTVVVGPPPYTNGVSVNQHTDQSDNSSYHC